MAKDEKPKKSGFRRVLILLLMVAGGLGIWYFVANYWDHQDNPFKTQTSQPGEAVESLAERFGITEREVGAIMFVCNDESHGDREVVIRDCPNCEEGRNTFFSHPKKDKTFYCLKCDEKFPEEELACEKCGGAPQNPVRLKR